jgi:hypothetical protein
MSSQLFIYISDGQPIGLALCTNTVVREVEEKMIKTGEAKQRKDQINQFKNVLEGGKKKKWRGNKYVPHLSRSTAGERSPS